jgi:hypothetical protein
VTVSRSGWHNAVGEDFDGSRDQFSANPDVLRCLTVGSAAYQSGKLSRIGVEGSNPLIRSNQIPERRVFSDAGG